jgi:acetyltransferase
VTIRNLHHALRPRSVALIGATEREGSVGATVMRNLISGGFAGPIWPVNPGRDTVMGVTAFADVASLPEAPDLAVLVTPPEAVPGLIAELGAKGTRVALVITAGLNDGNGLRQAMLDAARPHMMRVIGPNTVGLMIPPIGLNAGFAHSGGRPGNLALLSQSGAMATALVDWAEERGIGFSQIVSLGDMADVDVGDYLDLLAGDRETQAILCYLETVPAPRKFLSAGRQAARLKPVVVIKAGRHREAAEAAATHTGALSGADEVVDAALRRAGILRVTGLGELFAAAETMARFRPLSRGRLGIVTNGGGAGVLAVDRLMDLGGELAELAPATIAALDSALPPTWSRANPVDIIGDAPPERYVAALEAVAADPGVDVVLVMNCPTGLAAPEAAAEAVAGKVVRGQIGTRPVLSAWLGGETARRARSLLREAGVASYETPATAAAAVRHLTDWGRAQAALLRVPSRSDEAMVTPEDARSAVAPILSATAAEGRRVLDEVEAKRVLSAYGMPVTETRPVADAREAERVAAEMLREGGQLVLKLLSRDISHKSDVGGVVLGLETAREVGEAAAAMAERVARRAPDARIDGFTLQPMVRRPEAEEVILGLGTDPIFGPVILFGAGGVKVEVLQDTAVALPPLDSGLAADLVARTRIGRLLAGYRNRPPADAEALHRALVALSHLAEDFPCIRGADINPLLVDAQGVIAVDARIEIEPDEIGTAGPNSHFAIRPYPAHWSKRVALKGQDFLLRPIRPTDAFLYPAFLERLDAEAIRMRFLAPRRHFPDEMGLRLTQLDYDRDMAFVALDAEGALAGVARLSSDPDRESAEYALIVRTDLEGRGLGSALLGYLIDYAAAEGIGRLEGPILAENHGMIRLVQRLGFRVAPDPDDPALVTSRRDLRPAGA